VGDSRFACGLAFAEFTVDERSGITDESLPPDASHEDHALIR
jgi:hypothetical protein